MRPSSSPLAANHIAAKAQTWFVQQLLPAVGAAYFFATRPIFRAIRLTEPVWRASSAAIFDAPTPRRSSCFSLSFSASDQFLGFAICLRLPKTIPNGSCKLDQQKSIRLHNCARTTDCTQPTRRWANMDPSLQSPAAGLAQIVPAACVTDTHA